MKIAIYNPYLETKGGGEKMALTMAEILASNNDNQVFLVTHQDVDLQKLEHYFDLNLQNVRVISVDFSRRIAKLLNKLHLPGRIRNLFFDIKVRRDMQKHKFDVFINSCYQSNLPNMGTRGYYLCMFPQVLDTKNQDIGLIKLVYIKLTGWLSRILLHPSKRHPIDTYDHVISISSFTRRYVKKYWNRDSIMLFPVCDNMYNASLNNKQKVILHVGRFFENIGNSHHKRQDVLLQAFSEMKELHKDGWELHFVGSVAEDVGALRYILKLIQESQGLPVRFHFNGSFQELKELYNKATIYWHATGYGSNPEKYPEKQEHFGITTVEAMSAGCIPVVINTAGQKETVAANSNGYLWNTLTELKRDTLKIARAKPSTIKQFQAANIAGAKDFNKAAFAKQVKAIFDA